MGSIPTRRAKLIKMTRQENNFKILVKLHKYFTKYPDQRFIQGLFNVGIVEQIDSYDIKFGFKDSYAEEPKITLERVKKQLKNKKL